jgi:hypothetical protein
MPDDPMAPGRAEDVTADSGSGRDTDLGSPSSRPESGDEPHRAFGSSTPGEGSPLSAEDANPEADATGPSEGTPEDLRPGGEREGLDDDAGADAGEHGREAAP